MAYLEKMNMGRSLDSEVYDAMRRLSINEDSRESFWGEEALKVEWKKFPDTILDTSNPPMYRWYKDGLINMSVNCLD